MISFLLAGVGGQGIVLASDILAEVGAAAGYDVKKSEIHGMSQRGGSVDGHVRWGEKVFSPTAARGEVGYMLAFEMMEGARHAGYLASKGVVIVNTQRIPPLTVASGEAEYPCYEDLIGIYQSRASRVVEIDALALARGLGKPAVISAVMLGALSSFLDVGEEVWIKVIERRVPAGLLEVNLAAFRIGRQAVAGGGG